MADDDKNPLDVLEELLKDSGGGSGAAPADPKKDLKEGELTDEELAEKRQAFEEKKAEQTKVDAEDIVQQKVLLQSIKETPEYMARVQQDQDKADSAQSNEEASAGFEINQLGHDKI